MADIRNIYANILMLNTGGDLVYDNLNRKEGRTTVLVAISDSSGERESRKPFRNENTKIHRHHPLE